MSEFFDDKEQNDIPQDADTEEIVSEEIILDEDIPSDYEISDDETDSDDVDTEYEDDVSDDADDEFYEEETKYVDDETDNDEDDVIEDSDDLQDEDESIEDSDKIKEKNRCKVIKFKGKKRRKISSKKAKIITICVAVFLLAVLVFTDIIPILPNAYNRFYVGNTYEIGETQGCVFDKFGENVLYAGNGAVMSFGPDMSCDFKVEVPVGSPNLETGGNNAVVYFAGSTDALVITNKNKTKSIKTTDTITAATVNGSGYYGFVTNEPGYESCIEIFGSDGKTIYKYHTNNPIIDISVSDNGKNLIASSYEISEDGVSGKIIFVDMTTQNAGNEVVVDSNLFSEVKFINNNTAVAFGDLCTVAYTGSGVEKWRIKYDNRNPKFYDVSSTGDIAFVFNRDSSELSESTVEIYSSSGKLKGKYQSKNNVKYISGNNDYFLLSLDRQTILLDDEGDVVKKKNTKKDFKKAVLYSNYNFAFSITDGVSEIMSVKH